MRRFLYAVSTAAICLSLIAPSAAGPTPAGATAANRSLTLTIFGDFATVRDVRKLALVGGVNHIAFPNISPMLEPSSVFFTDVASNRPFWIIEQNFNSNVLSSAALLQASVGKTVTVIYTNPTTGAQTRESAVVLSAEGPILRFRDRIETEVPTFGRIAYPSLRGALLLQPSLEADIGSAASNNPRVALTYITDGFAWTADYIVRFDANVNHADIDVLATVTNNSGASYENAALQLVSGSVQRQRAEGVDGAKVLGAIRTGGVYSVAESTNVTPSRQPLGEFYLYVLPHSANLEDKHTKQFTLLTGENVPVNETHEIAESAQSYLGVQGDPVVLPVGTFVSFKNQGPQLGVPLPSGTLHMYKNDASGVSEFIGEDVIERTPRLSTVRLSLGESYDLTAKRIQTDYRKNWVARNQGGGGYWEHYSTYRITISNAKLKALPVSVYEELPELTTITGENLPHATLSSTLVAWTVNVPASGSAKLEYSVRVTQE